VTSKTIIVAFAPGAKGFALSRWLLNNKLVFALADAGPQFKEINHTLAPWYNDVLFYYNNSSQDVYLTIDQMLSDPDSSDNTIKELIATSKNIPFEHALPGLVMTHHSTEIGLQRLKEILNATLIRITFLDAAQATESLVRKAQLDNIVLNFDHQYVPFLKKFDFAINVTLDQVNQLDLDFLKEQLL
jgi:hypothetical protein